MHLYYEYVYNNYKNNAIIWFKLINDNSLTPIDAHMRQLLFQASCSHHLPYRPGLKTG